MDISNLDGTGNGLNEIIEDMAERLLPHAAARIGIQHSDLKRGLKLRLKSSHEVNAYVNTSDDWENFEITINDALMIFYHKMLKVYVSTLAVGDIKTHVLEKPTIPLDRIVSVCKQLMEAFWEDRLLTQGGFWLKELGEGQIVVLTYLRWGCECFSVAHELGHVVIGRTKGKVAEYVSARRIVEDFLQHIPDLRDNEKRVLIEPWTNEICADLIGLQLCLAQPNIEPYDSSPNYKQWLCGGAEISSLLRMMLQEFYDRLNSGSKISLISTHLHDSLRWKAIHSSSEKMRLIDSFEFGKGFLSFSMGVLDEIFRRTEDGGYKLKS